MTTEVLYMHTVLKEAITNEELGWLPQEWLGEGGTWAQSL